MNLPNDPAILLSYINTMLRDNFSSLDDLCKSLCADRKNIEDKLSAIGYTYSEKQNRFI
ncbi:MAG: DUF4250 domain-containing protein [Ruminococcus sp.]|nr:DUF4250 domain-containing protein [Ruminococcus sp.]